MILRTVLFQFSEGIKTLGDHDINSALSKHIQGK
jgi:hypothetical protein